MGRTSVQGFTTLAEARNFPEVSKMLPDPHDVLVIDPAERRIQAPAAVAEAVRTYQRADKADATIRAYTSDTVLFDVWCREQGFAGSVPA